MPVETTTALGYLTYSMLRVYLSCPRKYKYIFVDGWKKVKPNAAMLFGSMVHEALAYWAMTDSDPAEYFSSAWDYRIDPDEVAFSKRESYDSLMKIGVALCNPIPKILKDQGMEIAEVEKELPYYDNKELVLKGTADAIAIHKGKNVLLDWKTAAAPYKETDVELDYQFSIYSMLTGIQDCFYIVMIKRLKEPEIQVLHTSRGPEQWGEALKVLDKSRAAIARGEFEKNPSFLCKSCDFRGLCCSKVQDPVELVQRPVKDRYAVEE